MSLTPGLQVPSEASTYTVHESGLAETFSGRLLAVLGVR
jgi:hypothetical protein